jgi:hypothetical protein
MRPDPAIVRIRDARQRISASVADDPARVVSYYIEMQKRFGTRLRPGPAVSAGGAAEQSLAADVPLDPTGLVDRG